MKVFKLILMIILLPALCLATPAGVTPSSFTFDNGDSVDITGTGFTTNPAAGTTDLQWLGDNIEAGTLGANFAATGWANAYPVENTEETVAIYSDNYAHSGTKALLHNWYKTSNLSINRYKGHIYRAFGGDTKKIYFSYWQRVNSDYNYYGSNGQYKLWRLNNDSAHPIPAGTMGMGSTGIENNGYPFFLTTDSGSKDGWLCDGCANENPAFDLYDNSGAALFPAPQIIEDRWCRIEIWVDCGTTDNYDGTFQYWLHDPDDTVTPGIRLAPEAEFINELLLLESSATSDGFTHLILGEDAVSSLDMRAYHDDIFVQVGTQSRVEIGNASTWAACTHREIQIPTSWNANGQAITFDVNQGSLTGTNYLYVVDSAGVTNTAGVEITFGDAPATTSTINCSIK